ncbi:MAG: UDP-diphosphatase [Flammeovirgaceae bacterium]|nr:UDP-diphosphatase [Flammeovirgaceae bacterium]|tara:strand:+ start:1875 stop:2672 length:798 start_codon:yes stop_codon:yes gene_type:complete
MTWIDALILGIVQGLTEFIPVSSSGHLEIGVVLLGINSTNNLLFSLVVHLATCLSTIFVFHKDILFLTKGLLKFEWNDSTQFVLKIIISMIPVGVVGLLFESKIETFFTGDLFLVGGMLLVTSILLFIPRYFSQGTGEVTFEKSLVIGLAQSIAILPGISRSGSTIAMALILGVSREKAAKFSFLMVLLPIIGASLVKIKNYVGFSSLESEVNNLNLFLGFTAAFISGYMACRWMMKVVKKGKLIYFSIYCFILSLFAISFSYIL